MAARGNRLGRVARFGVASLATAAAILGSAQAALAQEAPPPAPPSETASTETTPAPEPPPPATTTTETTASDPPPADTAATPDPAPKTDATPATEGAAPAATDPTPKPEAEPGAASTPAPKDVVKLEPAQPAPTPAAPAAAQAPAAPSSPPPAEQALASPAAVTIVLVASTTAADPAKPAPSPAAGAEDVDTAAAVIVSFRPRPAIALLPHDEPNLAAPIERTAVAATAQKKRSVVRQACARPAARVPLSLRCKQQAVLAVAVARVVRVYSPSLEVRAAIDRAAAVMTARPVEARPPPESKAAKKKARPIAEVRPTIPFGSSGQGASNDGFSSSGGASWSSRVFALAAVPLRVPHPFRFARVQLPQTIAHGVIAAPPTTRPG